MGIRRVALADVLPNPYRSIDVFDEQKIERLMQSYENSGFWDGSIQGRPTAEGKIEIAFGHHRVEAAKRRNIAEIGIVVADRSNAEMLRMMGDENAAEFRHDVMVTIETIGAVVGAYERGEIELEPVDPKTNSSVTYALPGGKAYSLATVARFLGWVKPSDGQATNACRAAFDAFRERAATEEAISSLCPSERTEIAVETIVTAARCARSLAEDEGFAPTQVRQAESMAAQYAAAEVTDINIGAGSLAVSIARRAVSDVKGPKDDIALPVHARVAKLLRKFKRVEPYDDVLEEYRQLVEAAGTLDAALARNLADALEKMLRRSSRRVDAVVQELRSTDVLALLEEDVTH